MAKSVNKVILVGRLGKDPELKYTASGTPFCRFSMATDDVWNDKSSGERQEKTEWHNIVVWDRLAEICNQYLTKGRLVYIEGSLQTREWDDQEGNKRRTTEFRAREMVISAAPEKARAAGRAARLRWKPQPGAVLLPAPAPAPSPTTIYLSDVWFLKVSRYPSGPYDSSDLLSMVGAARIA